MATKKAVAKRGPGRPRKVRTVQRVEVHATGLDALNDRLKAETARLERLNEAAVVDAAFTPSADDLLSKLRTHAHGTHGIIEACVGAGVPQDEAFNFGYEARFLFERLTLALARAP
jgi:hypothetical protein